MRRAAWLVWLLSACACEGTTQGPCSPVGFVVCSGNDLVTCEPDPGSDGGIASRRDCTAEGLVCVGSLGGTGACGTATVGGVCMVRNYTTCAGDDAVVRCVFVSEQPEPGLSGDIGVWRAQTECAASGQVCRNAACATP